MRIFVAGASGAVGRALVPLLLARGHVVGGLSRSAAGAALVREFGAEAFIGDALDEATVMSAFESFKPEAVVHQLTAIPAETDLRDFDAAFAATNRLRTEGTRHLLAASRRFGIRRFVTQSFCGWTFARTGGPVKTEEDPLDPDPPTAFRRTLDALRELEQAMADARDLGGVALRYGAFYGPGTTIADDGAMVRQLRRRLFPVIGKGTGIWSFLHIEDAAEAVLSAVEGEAVGIYNVVDDDPAPVREWLPYLAQSVGAKPPLYVPAFVGRLLLPEHLRVMMTEVRGASNAQFRRAFNWAPSYGSWRVGFREGLGR